jgi:hypothetical protein
LIAKIVEEQYRATIGYRIVVCGGVVVDEVGAISVEPRGGSGETRQLIGINHGRQDPG